MAPAAAAVPERRAAFLRSPAGALALLLIAGLLWGSAFPGIKRGYVLLGIGPGAVRAVLIFAGLRFLLAGLLVLGGGAAARVPLRLSTRQLGAIALLGLVQISLQYATFYVGLALTTGTKASLIVASGSLFLAVLSPLFFAEDRLTPPRVAGLLVGFSGVALANLAGRGLAGGQWLGDLLMVGSGLSSATASLLAKRLVRRIHPVALNGYQVLFGGLFLLSASLPFGPLAPPAVAAELVLLTGYLSIVTTVAFTLYYVVIRYHDLTRVAAYRFVIPLCGLFESALFIPGESLGWPLLVAAGLVAAGILIVNRPPR